MNPVLQVYGSLLNVHISVHVCVHVCVDASSTKNKKLIKLAVTKIYHLYVSASVIILLQMAHGAAGMSRMTNFTHCGMHALKCELARKPAIHFYVAVWCWQCR